MTFKTLTKIILGSGVFCSLAQGQETLHKKEPLEQSRILHTKIHKEKGKPQITLLKLKSPTESEINDRMAARVLQTNSSKSTTQPTSQFATAPDVVFTTSYPNGFSVVKWHSHDQGEVREHTAFSNINWSVMTSIQNLKGEHQAYSFMLFNSPVEKTSKEANLPKFPADLPPFKEAGARFIIQDAKMEETQNAHRFMTSVHSYFDQNVQALLDAYQSRLSENKSDTNSNQPQDVEIRYWVQLKPAKETK